MIEKSAANAAKRSRAADTARWRERQRRGEAILPLVVDGPMLDLAERFAGLKAEQMENRDAVAAAVGRLLRRGVEALLREESHRR